MTESREQPQRLQDIVDVIVEEGQPEQVILFGSRAKGTAREGSDYDFLIVVQGVPNEPVVSRRIYRALLEIKIGAAVDLVVVNADTLERRKESPFYVYGQALCEGRIFYDRGGL